MDLTPTRKDFQKGDRVEVSSRDYGFIGAYYEATVVEDLGGKYKVEYLSLVDEKDESRQLQGDVDADELRPLPPSPSEQEKMKSTITEVKKEGEKEIYSVYLETTADLCDYSKEQLTFHKDWIDGAWVDCNDKKQKQVGCKKRVWIDDNVEDRYKKVRIDGKLVDCKDKLRVSPVIPTGKP
ncbi:hypothetical protein EV1_032934 [Malus domestica]